MIALLHKNNVVEGIINDVLSVDGDSIQAVDGGAKGIGHSVLIVDGYTYNDEEQTITNGSQTINIGDTINPADFTDTRAQLPKTPEQEREVQIASLETESVDTMLALTEVYETTAQHDTTREQENVDTMLALTEVYDMILQLQATNDALTARIVALEGGVS